MQMGQYSFMITQLLSVHNSWYSTCMALHIILCKYPRLGLYLVMLGTGGSPVPNVGPLKPRACPLACDADWAAKWGSARSAIPLAVGSALLAAMIAALMLDVPSRVFCLHLLVQSQLA